MLKKENKSSGVLEVSVTQMYGCFCLLGLIAKVHIISMFKDNKSSGVLKVSVTYLFGCFICLLV